MENCEPGILLKGERLNNIRYADDTVVFADSLNGLQEIVNKVNEVSEGFGLEMNISKTKFMVISKDRIGNCQLLIKNAPVERVEKFTYLGTIVIQWDHSQEIKSRIEKARGAYNNMSKLFRSHNLKLDIKVRLLRCYVFSILYYGVESWTLTVATERKHEAFEMWLYRRILRISWMDRVTNETVLERMKKGKR